MPSTEPGQPPSVTLFLCGDVMAGRGIDQILARPTRAELRENGMRRARAYVELARERNGPIPMPVEPQYIWGDALEELRRRAPWLRVANLETTITESDELWDENAIGHRMRPKNVGSLGMPGFNVCTLANDHVLDFSERGLLETLSALRGAGITPAGAGRDLDEASRPAAQWLPGGGRVLIFAFGAGDGGVPLEWQATAERPGINLVADLSEAGAAQILRRIGTYREARDLVVASIHWGSNWGYEVPAEHIRFAHRLVEGGVDVVHGHSSHHPRPIEIWNDRLILYGCGDFIDDHEGIPGYEPFRADLVLMYFVELDPGTGALRSLEMVPLNVKRMRLWRASAADALWLAERLTRISAPLGTAVLRPSADGGAPLSVARAPAIWPGGVIDDGRLRSMLTAAHLG